MIRKIIGMTALTVGLASHAHFQTIMPDTVFTEGKSVNLDVVFTHPMSLEHTMEMGTPVEFGVLTRGKKKVLTETLISAKLNGKQVFKTKYRPKAPGDMVFYLTPEPYFEKAEELYIQQNTKVVVNAFGESTGWDESVGADVEIMPLVRPYGLWTGMVFRAKVMVKGQPLKNAEIEVEYWNEGGVVKTPSDVYDNQVIMTDDNGVFAFALPKEGWWGFAALDCIEGTTYKGKRLSVDGVIFVKCMDVK